MREEYRRYRKGAADRRRTRPPATGRSGDDLSVMQEILGVAPFEPG
ncbi:hypothetical protein [Methanoculleus sp.]|nr:hypothetical protein [Methanoculleus sp.]MCK9319866.1 hypothetical protein [Methanoculleus sp.]